MAVGLMLPAGEFAAVSAGGSHSCGLRSDHTIVCWGSNVDSVDGTHSGQADAPLGRFGPRLNRRR